MGEKVDFKKSLDAYRARRGQFRVVDVPPMHYLMVDGHGDPNTSPAFTRAIEALYPVAYKLKFASKAELGRDYVVPPLEGLWWADDMESFTQKRDKDRWDWTLMLMVPDWIDPEMFTSAIGQVAASGRTGVDAVRLDELVEGRCVQTLHVGAFDEEAQVLDELHHDFLPHHGLVLAGRHHEIYLSDLRRVLPEKQRTILRQPVRKQEESAPPQET